MLFDTHCHLDFPPLFDNLPAVLAQAGAAGVHRFLVPAVCLESWQRIAALSAANPLIYPAFGLHPMCACQWSLAVAEELALRLSKGAAAGEIGLDYVLEEPSRSVQQTAFRAQLQLAMEAGVPVIIHCRKAFGDLLRILKEETEGEICGIMHAFSGSLEVARECIGLGLKIGIAGPVTWSNAVRPLDVVRGIPLEQLVLETDSPDLAPEPHRGGVNEPAFLVAIAQKVADIKGVGFETVACATTLNAERILNVRTTPFFPH
jgi:TatD DNase family protein